MRKSLKWLLALLVLALAVAGAMRLLANRKAQQASTAALAASTETYVTLAPTDVVRAGMQDLVRTLPLSGSLRAVDSAVLKARVAGELTGLTVREGDAVTAGQVIARIEPTEYRSRVRQTQEQADSARAQAEVTQRAYDNNKALVAQGFISGTALDASQSNLNSALATHRAALAAVDVARKTLDDTVLRSPLSGLVAQRMVQPGERVSIDTRVIEVVDLSRLEVEATLAAADSVAVQVGQRATLEIEGSGSAQQPAAAMAPGDAGSSSSRSSNTTGTGTNAATDRFTGASVVRVNPSAQAGSRSVLVYLRLDRSTGFRQGLFAQGTIEIGRIRTMALPLSAVRVDKPEPYVQVVIDGRIAHRPVRTGQRGSGTPDKQGISQPLIEVSGVEDGALVAAGAVGALREGTAVRLAGDAATLPPAAPASSATPLASSATPAATP